jgi:hypothetical protein
MRITKVQGAQTASISVAGMSTQPGRCIHVLILPCSCERAVSTYAHFDSKQQQLATPQVHFFPTSWCCVAIAGRSGSSSHATTKYIPSDLEQAWLANAGKWEQDFCSNMAVHNPAVITWLDNLKEHASLQDQSKKANKSPAQVRNLAQARRPSMLTCSCSDDRHHGITPWAIDCAMLNRKALKCLSVSQPIASRASHVR